MHIMENNTHSKLIGYILWIFGFMGAHRFYYGRPVSGTVYFFTLGLLLVGWLVDLFLIPAMDKAADSRYIAGEKDYNIHRRPVSHRLFIRLLDAE